MKYNTRTRRNNRKKNARKSTRSSTNADKRDLRRYLKDNHIRISRTMFQACLLLVGTFGLATVAALISKDSTEVALKDTVARLKDIQSAKKKDWDRWFTKDATITLFSGGEEQTCNMRNNFLSLQSNTIVQTLSVVDKNANTEEEKEANDKKMYLYQNKFMNNIVNNNNTFIVGDFSYSVKYDSKNKVSNIIVVDKKSENAARLLQKMARDNKTRKAVSSKKSAASAANNAANNAAMAATAAATATIRAGAGAGARVASAENQTYKEKLKQLTERNVTALDDPNWEKDPGGNKTYDTHGSDCPEPYRNWCPTKFPYYCGKDSTGSPGWCVKREANCNSKKPKINGAPAYYYSKAFRDANVKEGNELNRLQIKEGIHVPSPHSKNTWEKTIWRDTTQQKKHHGQRKEV